MAMVKFFVLVFTQMVISLSYKIGNVSNIRRLNINLIKIFKNKRISGFFPGTFNIPKGIYWSQPVTLEKGFWTPFPDYPVPRKPDFNLYDLFLFSIASLYRTGVKPRFYYLPKQPSTIKKAKKI